jgi:hypothetical protein
MNTEVDIIFMSSPDKDASAPTIVSLSWDPRANGWQSQEPASTASPF